MSLRWFKKKRWKDRAKKLDRQNRRQAAKARRMKWIGEVLDDYGKSRFGRNILIIDRYHVQKPKKFPSWELEVPVQNYNRDYDISPYNRVVMVYVRFDDGDRAAKLEVEMQGHRTDAEPSVESLVEAIKELDSKVRPWDPD